MLSGVEIGCDRVIDVPICHVVELSEFNSPLWKVSAVFFVCVLARWASVEMVINVNFQIM